MRLSLKISGRQNLSRRQKIKKIVWDELALEN